LMMMLKQQELESHVILRKMMVMVVLM